MKFDVFISFRGIDTRRTFVSHLMLSLFKNWITTFKYEEEILENQPPSSQVLQAIEESKVAIVVISKNYAASSWCLDELAKIFECRERELLDVVPVFYEVDPSDVLRQVDDLADHADGYDNLDKVNRWRYALGNLIRIYYQKYSYWENEDSYSYIVDRVLIHVAHCLSKSETVITAQAQGPCYGKVLTDDDFATLTSETVRHQCATYETADFAIPRRSRLSLLRAIVTKRIRLFVAALKTIVGKFVYGKESIGAKPRPLWRFLDVQNDNYVIGNNLSQLVLSNDFNSFVGMDRHMKAVYTLLDLESSDAILEIGISGKHGVGKTTLARCVYEQISPQFQDHHYFINYTNNCSPGACLLDDIARASLTDESESLDEVVKAKAWTPKGFAYC